MTDTKYCRMCDAVLPLEAFGFNRAAKDGRGAYCRSCINGYQRKRRYDPTAVCVPRHNRPEVFHGKKRAAK